MGSKAAKLAALGAQALAAGLPSGSPSTPGPTKETNLSPHVAVNVDAPKQRGHKRPSSGSRKVAKKKAKTAAESSALEETNPSATIPEEVPPPTGHEVTAQTWLLFMYCVIAFAFAESPTFDVRLGCFARQ